MAAYVVGLTGGIGCGKTAVSDAFAALGVTVVDTDVIARQLTAVDGAAMPAVRETFGAEAVAPDGALDRAWMRRRVFADAGERVRLEAILHPMIRAASRAAVTAARSPYVLLVVPLLLESGEYRQRVDRLLVVDCPPAVQRVRTMARSGLSADEAQAIIDTQVGRSERLAAANDVLDNGGGLDALAPQVARLHAQYLNLAAQLQIRH